ncbi:MAG TPA: hypothetical protein VKP69_22100, partial [Isosphaeraceae bacterium]|nr:hypothetical protein [Isosphaeraceae bacterium]
RVPETTCSEAKAQRRGGRGGTRNPGPRAPGSRARPRPPGRDGPSRRGSSDGRRPEDRRRT